MVKNLPANAGDMGWIPGLGRSPGEGHGNSLQYSCLENPMDRGAWHAMGHRVTELENWSNLVHTHACMSQYIIHLTNHIDILLGFPGGSDGKASAYNAGDLGSIPG